jgi:hypothetical protein
MRLEEEEGIMFAQSEDLIFLIKINFSPRNRLYGYELLPSYIILNIKRKSGYVMHVPAILERKHMLEIRVGKNHKKEINIMYCKSTGLEESNHR